MVAKLFAVYVIAREATRVGCSLREVVWDCSAEAAQEGGPVWYEVKQL